MKITAQLVNRKEVPYMKSHHYRKLFAKPRVKIFDDSKMGLCDSPDIVRQVIKMALDELDFGPDVRAYRSIGGGDYVLTAEDLDPKHTAHAFDVEIHVEADWPIVRQAREITQPFSDW